MEERLKMKTYRNRYGNSYQFTPVDADTVKIEGDLDYWRFGGREGQDGIDENDLGFVDPSGGPFLSVGGVIEGRKILRIASKADGIFFTLE
jgi:hypothetical protein